MQSTNVGDVLSGSKPFYQAETSVLQVIPNERVALHLEWKPERRSSGARSLGGLASPFLNLLSHLLVSRSPDALSK